MDFKAWVAWVLDLWQHYPDLVIMVGSSAFGMLPTLALEWWFLPTVTDPDAKRRQKGYTFLFCWLVSSSSSAMLWWVVDPADPLRVRVTVSVIFGAFGFFAYPPIARILTDKFPALGSAWDGLRNKE